MTARARDSERPNLLLWQLVDSAFPTGGFAHSGGLEAAAQHGAIPRRAELVAFLDAALLQAAHGVLPLVRAAHVDPDALPSLDRHCDAFISNHVANRASRLQGRALLGAAKRIFLPGGRPLGSPATDEIAGAEALAAATAPCGHLAPVFGAVARWLGLGEETTMVAHLFQHLRGLVAAAVRLNLVGPMEAQAIQFGLRDRLETLAGASANRTVDDLAQTAPLLEIWQGAQDRLYSRLFQS